jgi:hypothetical protein
MDGRDGTVGLSDFAPCFIFILFTPLHFVYQNVRVSRIETK